MEYLASRRLPEGDRTPRTQPREIIILVDFDGLVIQFWGDYPHSLANSINSLVHQARIGWSHWPILGALSGVPVSLGKLITSTHVPSTVRPLRTCGTRIQMIKYTLLISVSPFLYQRWKVADLMASHLPLPSPHRCSARHLSGIARDTPLVTQEVCPSDSQAFPLCLTSALWSRGQRV